MEAVNQTGDAPGVARDAAAGPSDQVPRGADSRIEALRANRRRQHRSQLVNEQHPGDPKTLSQVAGGAFKPAPNAAAAEALTAAGVIEVASQGMASSTTLPAAIPTLPTMATIKPLQSLSSAISGAESVPGARTTTKGAAPSFHLDQLPSQDSARSATVTTRSARAGSDVVARIKLIQRVSKAFQHLGPDGGSVRIRLAPAELGSVRVEMQVHDRQVKARVVAETDAASTALREHLPDLRARLESYGMQVERLEVETEATDRGFDGRQEADSHWQSSQHQQRSGSRFTTEPPRPTGTESEALPPSADTTAAIRDAASGGVDVRL